MKIKLLLLLLICAYNSFCQNLTIHFDNNSATVNDTSVASLAKFAQQHIDCKMPFIVHGYASALGTVDANFTLSLKRAEAVAAILRLNQIENISVAGFGEEQAIKDGDTTNNGIYRRVSIFHYSQEGNYIPCAGVIRNSTIAELYEQLKDEGQEFCINPDRDTALVGKNGTIVYYKQGTFKNTTGCACLKLVLHEFYDKADLVMNNLTTTSDERPLESGGMIKLEGFCGKDSLEYEAGKFLTVMMPTDTLLPDMKLLSANRNRMIDVLNWQLDKQFPEIDGFDWNNMLWFCKRKRELMQAKGCPFFFCQIGNFFRGISKTERQLAKLNNAFSKENELLKKYELDETKLGAALEKSKEANKDLLKYYVYKNANWDYHNIDRYQKGTKFVDFIVEEKPSDQTDAKIIYVNAKTVLPAFEKSNSYKFKNVIDNQNIFVVGLKYSNSQAYISLSKHNSSTKKTNFDFKPVTIEELKTILQRIN